MSKTKIEWTDYTINFVAGCSKISQGCKHCYAEAMHKRLKEAGNKHYQQPFNEIHCDLKRLAGELVKIRNRKPMKVFINSMSDTFHESVGSGNIASAFLQMSLYSQHTFQILTKRVNFLDYYTLQYEIPKNVWIGVSICNNEDFLRVSHNLDHIRNQVSNKFFVSFEPLLDDLNEELLEWHIKKNFDWIIVGGESGPGARPMATSWVKKIRDLCVKYNKPFFFKQYSSYHNRKYKENYIDGIKWEQFPKMN